MNPKFLVKRSTMDVSLTLSDNIGLVFAKCTQHNWTVESLETVLLLIKLHMPKSVNFPTTKKQAEKFQPSKRHWIKNIYYCKECHNILKILSCTKYQKDYENSETLRNNKLILQLDVRKQLERLLSSNIVCLSLEIGLQKRSQNGILGGKLVKAPFEHLILHYA
ncbi:unnamed protein product [Allacma fusca]|uniref:Uncharacterized protein n=1 Tax=Allacma fusca TaxID=39272 RepID=A0A8J2LRS0_9HEXA|nr:unnamed protein product [Allacma fusca]